MPLVRPRFAPLGLFALVWGVLGVELILADALYRLVPRALFPFEEAGRFGLFEWGLYAGSVLALGFFEGYRGFHKAFSPRLAARALHLAREPRPLFVALAPLYVMALLHAQRRRLIASWVLVAAIVALVLFVRLLPEGARAIVNAGVVVGLGLGALSVAWHVAYALQRGPLVSPELPEG